MKAISADNYLIRPFLTHKTQEIDFVFLDGGEPGRVTVDVAVAPPVVRPWVWEGTNEPVNEDGLYKRTLYASVHHLFYNSASQADTGSRTDRRFTPSGSQFYVLNVAQSAYGEGIRRGSFRLLSTLSTSSIVDDGAGRLMCTSEPSAVIGNVFYEQGIAILQQSQVPFQSTTISQQGLWLTTGSALEIEFDASHTIYEHQVLCTMEPGEHNYSMNPSIRRDGTAVIIDQFASGTLTPYMTTVGCYNDQGEMVAVAKFPRPLKRATDSQQSVIVRFDI